MSGLNLFAGLIAAIVWGAYLGIQAGKGKIAPGTGLVLSALGGIVIMMVALQ